MSIDKKFGRYCDECGRTIVSAVRIHLGKDYCRACYQTTFLKVPCSVCGDSMRAHRHASGPAVCATCTRSDRTCLRCGKFTPQAGKLVGQSAVCNSCSPHFREPSPCTSCGRLSTRLSKPLFAGLQDAVCDSCRNALNHATCSICNRYRPVHVRGDDERPRCKDCLPNLQVTHPCPSCDTTVSGSGYGRCRPCINMSAVRRDGELLAAQLESLWSRSLWLGFVESQLKVRSESPALRGRVSNSAGFFQELEKHFRAAEEITSESLCAKIDSRLLRKHLLASRFVVSHLQLDGFEETREGATEHRRAEDILSRCQGMPWHGVLSEYLMRLRHEKAAPRTARLYLRAAETFCVNARVDASKPWPELAIVNHLKHLPGSANSLSRFVAHCKDRYGWDVQVPDKAKWASPSTKIKKSVETLRKALRDAATQPIDQMPMKVVTRVLSTAMGVPASQLTTDRDGVTHVMKDGAIQVTDEGLIELGSPLHPFAKRWADLVELRHRPKGGGRLAPVAADGQSFPGTEPAQ